MNAVATSTCLSHALKTLKRIFWLAFAALYVGVLLEA
jgi:hypothetical protein